MRCRPAKSLVFLALLLAAGAAAAEDGPAPPPENPAAAPDTAKPADAAPGAAVEAPPARPPEPAPADPAKVDLAFGAYQRGLFATAFREATQRVERDPGDAAAMTLLGVLSIDGLGVRQDWPAAAEWFRLAADRGDPQAAYSLAMLKLDGHGTPKDVAGARRLLESSADAVPAASTALGLMLLADQKPESDRRAAELFRHAANALDPDALYALALMARQGRGMTRDLTEAASWMSKAAAERNLAAQVEYGIMLFNGDGIQKDEAAAAKMFMRAAVRGSPVAENRLARLYAAGRGVPKNLVEAAKWHDLARRQGIADAWLDNAVKDLSPEDRRRADEAVARVLSER